MRILRTAPFPQPAAVALAGGASGSRSALLEWGFLHRRFPWRLNFGQKLRPRAIQYGLKAQRGGHKDIRFAVLNLLHYTGMQIHQLGELLLCISLSPPFTADVFAQAVQRKLDRLMVGWPIHAILWRFFRLTTTPRHGALRETP